MFTASNLKQVIRCEAKFARSEKIIFKAEERAEHVLKYLWV